MPFNQQRVGHLTYEIDPRHTALALLIRGNSVRGAWAQPAYPQRISALIGNCTSVAVTVIGRVPSVGWMLDSTT